MVWSSIEVLSSDLFRAILNRFPSLASNVVRDTKPAFSSNLSLDELSERGFNMNHNMGDFLLKERGLESLILMKAAYKCIFPTNMNLSKIFGSNEFWMLWQRRHLIVHRRGLVDQLYIDKTGDALTVGEEICIESSYIDDILNMVVDASVEMLRSGDKLFAQKV